MESEAGRAWQVPWKEKAVVECILASVGSESQAP